MKKIIAFYLDNSAVPNVDLSTPHKGNPGIGAAPYLHVAIPYFLNLVEDEKYEFHILAQNVDKMPTSLVCHRISSVAEAAAKAKEIGAYLFVFRPRIHEEESILDIIERLSLPSIGIAALTPHPNHIRKMSRCAYFKALVCVGREQFDSLIDTPMKRKLALINNGVSMDSLELSDHFVKDKNLVTYVGSLVPQKGFHILAEAWPKVLKQWPGAKLAVVGSAKVYDENAELGKLGIASKQYEEQYIAPYLIGEDGKLLPSVTFLGQMGVEKYQIMQKSLVGIVNPSGQTETCCVSAVEFSGCKTAVVTGAYYALLDTVRDQKTGLLGKTTDDLANNICSLLRNPNKAQELGDEGFRFVEEHYCFKAISHKWLELFDNIEHLNNICPPKGIRNVFSHRKILRLVNAPLQLVLGRICPWPSVQEVEYLAIKLRAKLRVNISSI